MRIRACVEYSPVELQARMKVEELMATNSPPLSMEKSSKARASVTSYELSILIFSEYCFFCHLAFPPDGLCVCCRPYSECERKWLWSRQKPVCPLCVD